MLGINCKVEFPSLSLHLRSVFSSERPKPRKRAQKALTNLFLFVRSASCFYFLCLSPPLPSSSFPSISLSPSASCCCQSLSFVLWLCEDVTCLGKESGHSTWCWYTPQPQQRTCTQAPFENTLKLIHTSPLETLERPTELGLLRSELAVCGH